MKLVYPDSCIAVALFTSGLIPLCAEESSTPAGHSVHGEAFNEGPRQAAYLMEGMPAIRFPITTADPEAQKFFNQGIGQLHGFWYFEAERSFRQVAALDPNCAMAFWGMAMANVNNEKRAKEFIAKAAALKGSASARELLWIEALAKFHESTDNNRHREMVRSLENIVEAHPDDTESKAFLVWKIWDNGGKGFKISSHFATDALTRDVLAANPLHPVHHYRIHLWNDEKDQRALNSAALCGQSSPGIGHMWHMPGHTFSKLLRYHEACWQQEASARVDHAHMIRDRVLPDQIHNYAHNNEWLTRNLSYVGRVHDAIELAKNLVELPRHPKYNTFTRYSVDAKKPDYNARDGSATYGRARLLDLLVRFELWDQLIELGGTMYLEPTDLPEAQARRARALGAAWFEKGDLARLDEQIRDLQAALQRQKELRQLAVDEAEAKARNEKQPDDKINKAMSDTMQAERGKVKGVEAALAELKMDKEIAGGKLDLAKEFTDDLGDVPKERLAAIHWRLGNRAKADTMAQEAVDAGPGQVHPLATQVDLYWRSERRDEAKAAFEKLRLISSGIDLDLPVFKRLEPVAQALQLPTDWRAAPPVASDLGERPALASLGQFRWQPSPAPAFALRDFEGGEHSLADYRGRPIIVLFYLGAGCPHCVAQLNVFVPAVQQFTEAGITLAGVSTETVEGLKNTFAQTTGAAPLPFLLLADPSLSTFKKYRVYDDFEQTPLHGLFLIDGDGFVRWQDISYEPFTDVAFLLKESPRLLALPSPLSKTATVR